MKELLYKAVSLIAMFHDKIMAANDSFTNTLSDKQLHFLVIGVIGMILFFLTHAVFKALIKHGHEMVVSWIYAFTLILFLTFSIEIGQKISKTGTMEFADIVFGVFGFLVLFAVFLLFRGILLLFKKLLKRKS